MSTEITTYSGTKKALTEGIQGGMLYACIEIIKEAKSLAPVNKQIGVGGRLRNSLMYRTAIKEGGFNNSSGDKAEEQIDVSPKELEAYVGSNLDYATYQEFGTRKMSPQPYLRPAIALVMGKDKNEIARKIKEETERGPIKQGQKRETFK